MATSGSFQTQLYTKTISGYGHSTTYTHGAEFSWERTSYVQGDSPTSTITWSLKPYGSVDSGSITYRCTVEIDSVSVGTSEISVKNVAVHNGQVTGTTTLTHNVNGSKSFVVKVICTQTGWLGDGDTTTNSQTYTLDALAVPASLTAAPSFNDEENPVITYSNPAGSLVGSLQAGITNSSGVIVVPFRAITKTASSYTFSLTSTERAELRKLIKTGNSTTVRFYLRTTIDNTNYDKYVSKTLTLINYMPTISPTVTDRNEDTSYLTGDYNILVRYMSDADYTFNAQAKKEATIVSRTVVNGNQTGTGNSGYIYGATSNTFTFTATDSRGYSVEETIIKEMVPYVRLTAALRIAAFTLSGDLIFAVDGNYFNGSFGRYSNSLSLTYTLKKNGQNVRTVTLNPQTQGSLTYGLDTYHYEYTITGLTPVESDGINNSYSVQVTISDQLINITTDEVTSSAAPIFHWGKNDFTFNVPVHFSRGFTNDVDLKTASFVRTLSLTGAGSFEFGTLDEMGLSGYHEIYSITGTISSEDTGRVYPIPSPPLGNYTGAYNLTDSTKFWIENDKIYITVAAAWGSVPVRLVLMYF